MLNILGLLDTFDSGVYTLAGVSMDHLSERRAADLRNRMIGFVFQSFNLIPFKTALENVALPLFYQGVGRRQRKLSGHGTAGAAWAGPVGPSSAGEMSGGQKQRVAIARAMITQPCIILADEPTGALDSRTSVEVMQLLRGLNAEE